MAIKASSGTTKVPQKKGTSIPFPQTKLQAPQCWLKSALVILLAQTEQTPCQLCSWMGRIGCGKAGFHRSHLYPESLSSPSPPFPILFYLLPASLCPECTYCHLACRSARPALHMVLRLITDSQCSSTDSLSSQGATDMHVCKTQCQCGIGLCPWTDKSLLFVFSLYLQRLPVLSLQRTGPMIRVSLM